VTKKLYKNIRGCGLRITQLKKEILNVLEKTSKPLSASDLSKDVKANKASIYRELNSLVKIGCLKEIDLADGVKRYELSSLKHHHLICLGCRQVEDIELDEAIGRQEKNIQKKRSFKILRHNLEFFGYCKNCQ